MKARATAAMEAMREVLSDLGPGASGREMGNAAADAALSAYDAVADREQRRRDISQGTESGASSADAATQPHQEAASGVSEALLLQRPTFVAVLVAYIVGLSAAFVANGVTGLGQPALLYIVPSQLLGLAASGATRGELERLWRFTDTPSWRPQQQEAQPPV
jgi:hypothetical protein